MFHLDTSVRQPTHCWIITSVSLLLIIKVKGSTYHISPSLNNSWCQDVNSCLILSELDTSFANRSDSNVSLIFIAGYHSLTSHLTFQNLTHFSMTSQDNSSTVIYCQTKSQLQFQTIKQVHIQGINFHGCSENRLTAVQEFALKDLIFYSPQSTLPNRRRILRVIKSTGVISNTVFQAFVTTRWTMGAINISQSYASISDSTFTGYNAQSGGAIYSTQSFSQISNCTFVKNSAINGGAIHTTNGIILITNSSFTKNNATANGGALFSKSNTVTDKDLSAHFRQQWIDSYSMHNNYSKQFLIGKHSVWIVCVSSNFSENIAKTNGGVIHTMNDSSLYVDRSYFCFNTAKYGGVLRIKASSVLIHNSGFLNNEAKRIGGVGTFSKSTVTITQSMFSHNQAGERSGALHLSEFTNSTINSGIFHNNRAKYFGGCLNIFKGTKALLIGSITFEHSSARYGGAFNMFDATIICNGSLTISNNNGSISTAHSKGLFAGNLTLINNRGSLYFFDSDVTISGQLMSTHHSRFMKQESDYTNEGGSLTLFISRVKITGIVLLHNNKATNGGGILSITSRIVLEKIGSLFVSNNSATDTGGGIYLYHSELYVQGVIHIYSNKARAFGGGIHCISSAIVIIIIDRRKTLISLKNNTANSGGGICLEASSKMYIKQLSPSIWTNSSVQYIENNANFGGAIFVADNSITGTCISNKLQSVTGASKSECFIQILQPITKPSRYPHIGDVFLFRNNSANKHGEKLFGGLLDRCTVNAFGKNIRYTDIPDSFDSILNGTTSEPVRVCLCKPESDMVDCSYIPPIMYYMKGSNLTLKVAAVDQVNNTVSATIHSYLKSRRGHIGDEQQAQHIDNTCTELNYSIISPVKKKHKEKLFLYADGPCSNLGISALKIKIRFIPCTCLTGFEPDIKTVERCVCRCHHVLRSIFPFIKDSDCNSETLLLTRNKDFWITAINLPNTTFISYNHCPYAYCHPSNPPVYIDFSAPNGADAQCAFNHTGMICGQCQPNFTLSLGSSRCIDCPQVWPAITVTVIIVVFITGLALVAIILSLNLTVATGTLNATIFYANILATNQQQLLPFKHTNFHSVFISWLNLDVGFDVCFFEGFNAYAKAWLQLTFPVYIIVIVAMVIVMSQHSKSFSNLISKKNPVATLATLILFSYAKLLHSIIGILSYAILQYTSTEKELFSKIVWLFDGSVSYLKGKHIPLFMIAVLIMTVGFLYTSLLLSWQWLVRLPNKPLFHWVRNTKLSSFIDAYHAPYTARNRYWTGLLLLARVILYLTTAMNISGEPSLNLLAISLIVGSILLLHNYSGIGIYKKKILNIFELSTYFNILAFVVVKFYIELVGGDHAVVAYISISVQIIIFVCSIIHHLVVEFRVLDKIKQLKCYKAKFNRDLQVHLLDNEVRRNTTVTHTEVAITKPNNLSLTDEDFRSERKELISVFGSHD